MGQYRAMFRFFWSNVLFLNGRFYTLLRFTDSPGRQRFR